MTRRYYIFILITLFALVALGERYLPTFQALSLKSKAEVTRSDFFLENMSSTVMLKNGKPNYTVKANRLTHFPDQDTVELDQVDFQLFRPSPSNWSANAKRGLIKNQKALIQLSGDVIFQRPASKTSAAITLATPELTIYSKKDYAETTAPVKIDSGNNRITAVGMRLYLKEGRMEFMSSTKVTYHAPRS